MTDHEQESIFQNIKSLQLALMNPLSSRKEMNSLTGDEVKRLIIQGESAKLRSRKHFSIKDFLEEDKKYHPSSKKVSLLRFTSTKYANNNVYERAGTRLQVADQKKDYDNKNSFQKNLKNTPNIIGSLQNFEYEENEIIEDGTDKDWEIYLS